MKLNKSKLVKLATTVGVSVGLIFPIASNTVFADDNDNTSLDVNVSNIGNNNQGGFLDEKFPVRIPGGGSIGAPGTPEYNNPTHLPHKPWHPGWWHW